MLLYRVNEKWLWGKFLEFIGTNFVFLSFFHRKKDLYHYWYCHFQKSAKLAVFDLGR